MKYGNRDIHCSGKKAKDQLRYDVFIQESILFSKKGKDLFLHGEKNLKMR